MFIPYVARLSSPPPRAGGCAAPPTSVHAVVETMRGLSIGHTSTGASVASQAALAELYCVATLVLSVAAASWLFHHRVSQSS